MMLPMLTLRKVFTSSPLQLVSLLYPFCRRPAPLTYNKELELDDEGTRISLTIVDTPGFGDQIDNEARYVESPHTMPSSSRSNPLKLW